ncbi:MAG: hypothetical protein KGZ25_00205, partial [Planctomycetes bacterium]|nr:hypothetical protein [Planctomycetota bacterium]
ERDGVELPVMEPQEYTDRVVQRITRAVVSAWNARRPGKVGFGLAHAVVGHNRRVTYSDGKSRMYGNINDPEFRHVEGYEDHSVNLLGTWNTDGKLTGLVVNVACPSQVSENEYQISADYWHETREELRSRLGDDVHVLAQCSAAGDQSPHLVGNQERNADNVAGKENAEVRMWRLAGHTQREEIAQRIADATEGCLPLMEKECESSPVLEHVVENVQLTRSQITPADVEEARRGAEEWKEKLGKLKNELKENPGEQNEPRWYVPITRAYRKVKWFEGVEKRYNIKGKEPKIPVEAHVVRIGDMVFSTNPFEYYLDFGLRMQARSRATQTFTVQLAGSGTYVPTEKAAASGSYGAVPASTTVGPQGGRELVEWSVETINSMWK